jgi:hypothetical protein
VDEQPDKVTAEVKTKNGEAQDGKEEGWRGADAISPKVKVPQRGEKSHRRNYRWQTLVRSPLRSEHASGTLWPTAKVTGNSQYSKGAALRRKSPGATGDVPGPLRGTFAEPTTIAYMEKWVVPLWKWGKETRYTCLRWERGVQSWTGFARRHQARSWPRRTAKLVVGNSKSFRATLGALQCLGQRQDVTFNKFSHPKNKFVGLLSKSLSKRMRESYIRKQVAALHIRVQAVMMDRKRRRSRRLLANYLVPVPG